VTWKTADRCYERVTKLITELQVSGLVTHMNCLMISCDSMLFDLSAAQVMLSVTAIMPQDGTN
jgi:hypothetical protein